MQATLDAKPRESDEISKNYQTGARKLKVINQETGCENFEFVLH